MGAYFLEPMSRKSADNQDLTEASLIGCCLRFKLVKPEIPLFKGELLIAGFTFYVIAQMFLYFVITGDTGNTYSYYFVVLSVTMDLYHKMKQFKEEPTMKKTLVAAALTTALVAGSMPVTA